MRVFVAGGTGFVGGNLCKALLESGHEIRLLVHGRRTVSEAGVERIEGDVTNLESFAASVSGCDAVINLVGIIREFPAIGITFEKLHMQATRVMIEATRQSGVRRFLQMSALGTRADAVSLYHQTKWQAEELLRGSGLDWTIFRPSLIFGPGDAFVNMLADLIRKLPVVPVIGDGEYRLQPIAVSDVARCFVTSLELTGTIGKTYDLCGADRMTYMEMLDLVGKVLGRETVHKIRQPLALMKLVTPFMQGFSFYPITMDQIQMLVEGSICDGSWQATFGFEPESFEPGIACYLKA